jgi:hypothetical protein
MLTKDDLRRAVADLWSQVLDEGDDYLVLADHYGNPARLRIVPDGVQIAWAVDKDGTSVWDEPDHVFADARHAALHAFQGPVKGRP